MFQPAVQGRPRFWFPVVGHCGYNAQYVRNLGWNLNMANVTELLAAVDQGDPQAAERLLPLVYDELRQLAGAQLAGERPGQTLQATALVHEAYVRLVGGVQPQQWDSRRHFFAAAAEAMRRILIESARRKGRLKRGGHLRRSELSDVDVAEQSPAEELLALDEALGEFEKLHSEKAQLVKLRYFAGLSEEQAASVLGISRATAARHWAFARAWLFEKMSK
jgi:RNA polymerase sigma factor (TIGR02999 family)